MVTFILLTPSCPPLFYHQAGLQKTAVVGELVHGAHHRFCSDRQLLHPASGENIVLILWCWVPTRYYTDIMTGPKNNLHIMIFCNFNQFTTTGLRSVPRCPGRTTRLPLAAQGIINYKKLYLLYLNVLYSFCNVPFLSTDLLTFWLHINLLWYRRN